MNHSSALIGHSGVTTDMFQATKVLPGETGWRDPQTGILYIVNTGKHKMKRVQRCYNIKALVASVEQQAKKNLKLPGMEEK